MISEYEAWLIDILPDPQPENLRVISEEELREYERHNRRFAEG